MIALLVFQLVSLLPPAPTPPVAGEADAAYQQQLQRLVQKEEVAWTQIEEFRPTSQAQRQLLQQWLIRGDRNQAKLAALLSANTSDLDLTDALFRAAMTRQETATSLTCLLAPKSMPPRYCAAMAYFAQESDRAISIRAAAAGRLLENGYVGVWPFCRSVFRSGTAAEERPIWADWRRGNRWELPKRLLLFSVNRLLATHELQPSSIEPNAAWAKQLQQLAATDALIGEVIAAPPKSSEKQKDGAKKRDAAVAKLFELALKGDAQAEIAMHWLAPHSRAVLHKNLGSVNLQRQEIARRILANTPR